MIFIPETHPKHKALTSVRERLNAFREEMEKVTKASLPAADAKARIQSMVEQAASQDRLYAIRASITSPHVASYSQFAEKGHAENPTTTAFELVCQLFPNQITEALEREAQSSIDPNALPLAERERVVLKLRKEYRKAELEEERLIEQLEAEGLLVHRREDADPAIVLNLPDPPLAPLPNLPFINTERLVNRTVSVG